MTDTSDDILIFDRERVRQNRERCSNNIQDYNFLANWCGAQLMERLDDVKRDFSNALHIGARASNITSDKIKNLLTMDLSEALVKSSSSFSVVGDEEFLPFKNDIFDLILSTLNLHSVNDLPGCLVQIRRTLKKDGLFMAAILGGETLHELRNIMMQAEINIKNGASPRIFPFADKQEIGALLQRAGFNLPVVDSDFVTVTYDNVFKLFEDLRGMGEGNAIAARSKSNAGKALFMETARLYQEQFADKDGRIRATFEIIFMIGWAPHESQQKPLRPGSARLSLAEALGTDEIKLKETIQP